MTTAQIPLVIEPEQLQAQLDTPDLLIVDLGKPGTYARAHIPGAIHLDYAQIIAMQKPAMGLLPDATTLSQVFSSIGLTPETHVIAYDDEGGGRAARLLWTLDAIGHNKASLLNGGIGAWFNEGYLTENVPEQATPGTYQATIVDTAIADQQFILEHLGDDNVMLLDSRSPEEYRGEKKFAERAGHIPGAVNLDWLDVMDKSRNMRLKPEAELRALMEERGLTEDKTIVTYCQTHHRSALTYFVLKVLGYSRVKGYPGSWSDWGNSENTPVETG
ncbi:MAG: sulfurtransferase [Gammaproteobacteria bacterium]|nr:sulfurtransferase [Gammaproteobacteria bacterium]